MAVCLVNAAVPKLNECNYRTLLLSPLFNKRKWGRFSFRFERKNWWLYKAFHTQRITNRCRFLLHGKCCPRCQTCFATASCRNTAKCGYLLRFGHPIIDVGLPKNDCNRATGAANGANFGEIGTRKIE